MPATWPVIFLLTIGMIANVAPSAPCTNIEAKIVIITAITSQVTPPNIGARFFRPSSSTPVVHLEMKPIRAKPITIPKM